MTTFKDSRDPIRYRRTNLELQVDEHGMDWIIEQYKETCVKELKPRTLALASMGYTPGTIHNYHLRESNGEPLFIEFFEKLDKADSDVRRGIIDPLWTQAVKDQHLRLKLLRYICPDLREANIDKAALEERLSQELGERLEKLSDGFLESLKVSDLSDEDRERMIQLWHELMSRQ